MLGSFLVVMLKFLAEYACLIWPVALLGDIVLSISCSKGTIHRLRWLLRTIHSLTFAVFTVRYGIEFILIEIVCVHPDGYNELVILGPLTFYICMRLAQRFDALPSNNDQRRIQEILALWIPTTIAVLLCLSIISTFKLYIPILDDRQLAFVYFIPFFSLIAAGSLCQCSVQRIHIRLLSYYGVASLLLTVALFIAWRKSRIPVNDDSWILSATGLVCFSILTVTSVVKRKMQQHEPGGDTLRD